MLFTAKGLKLTKRHPRPTPAQPLRATERLTQGHRGPYELGIQTDTRSPLRASQGAAFKEGLTTATSLTFSPLFEIH